MSLSHSVGLIISDLPVYKLVTLLSTFSTHDCNNFRIIKGDITEIFFISYLLINETNSVKVNTGAIICYSNDACYRSQWLGSK